MQSLSSGHGGKLLRHRSHKFIVLEVSGCGEHHVPSAESAAVKLKQLRLIESPYSGRCAQYRLAERMIFPEILSKELVFEYVGIILIDRSEEHTSELQS